MSEWKPIETAPRDGTGILIGRFAPGTQWDGRMEVDRVSTTAGFGTFNQWYPPTHWMPLPTPPQDDRHND